MTPLEAAHEAASAYHAAMARIIECREELDDAGNDDQGRSYWHKQYAIAVGEAHCALARMPTAWAEAVTKGE